MTDTIITNTGNTYENNDVNGNAGFPIDIDTPLSQKTTDNHEKLFTQSELEALIAERIKRERKVNEALIPVKELLKTACSKGLVKGKSYSEMAKDFVDKLSSFNEKRQNTQSDTSDNKDVCGKSTCTNLVAEDLCREKEEADMPANTSANVSVSDREKAKAHNEDEADKVHNQEISGKNSDTVLTVKDLCVLKEKYPKADMNKLLDSGMFESFAKGKSAGILEIYDDYCAFLGHFAQNASSDNTVGKDINENTSDDEKAPVKAYSTAISSTSCVGDTYGDGLTKRQMDIAKSVGMSYREYATLLSSIPKGKTRN